jgi:hypothetical protein
MNNSGAASDPGEIIFTLVKIGLIIVVGYVILKAFNVV